MFAVPTAETVQTSSYELVPRQNKTSTIGVPVSPIERQEWVRVASKRHMSMAEWLRHLARREVERQDEAT